jgi:hypothetical protein
MDIQKIDENYGKPFLIASVLIIWAVIIWSIFANGYLETWYTWEFPAKLPPFLDFRLIPSSAESFRAGFDPAVENPYEPRSRIFNYPKIWYLVFYTGITLDDTIWISITMLVIFFLIVLAFPEKIRVRDAIIMLGLIFSAACMLLYERGNVDILIFILCGLTLLSAVRYPAWSVTILSFAAMLKLFPFFGVTVFLQENKNRFFRLFLPTTLIFLVYIILTFESLKVSWNLTERGTFMSYGVYVGFELFYAYIRYYLLKVMPEDQILSVVKFAPHLLALTLLVFVFLLALRNRRSLFTVISERNLAAFRMGASIYVGTFLLGNNWDYRMVFLIFAMPQISQWLFGANSKYRWLSLGSLVALFTSSWATVLTSFYKVLIDPDYLLPYQIFDETMTWVLFAILTYLLMVTAPAWLWSLIPERKRTTSRLVP